MWGAGLSSTSTTGSRCRRGVGKRPRASTRVISPDPAQGSVTLRITNLTLAFWGTHGEFSSSKYRSEVMFFIVRRNNRPRISNDTQARDRQGNRRIPGRVNDPRKSGNGGREE